VLHAIQIALMVDRLQIPKNLNRFRAKLNRWLVVSEHLKTKNLK